MVTGQIQVHQLPEFIRAASGSGRERLQNSQMTPAASRTAAGMASDPLAAPGTGVGFVSHRGGSRSRRKRWEKIRCPPSQNTHTAWSPSTTTAGFSLFVWEMWNGYGWVVCPVAGSKRTAWIILASVWNAAQISPASSTAACKTTGPPSRKVPVCERSRAEPQLASASVHAGV